MFRRLSRARTLLRPLLLFSCALAALALLPAGQLAAEGSRTLFPADNTAPYRANLEWRTTVYGSADSPEFNVLRRTLLKLYAEAGEYILLGSSGVGVPGTPDEGDIRVFNPGQVSGSIGAEVIPQLAGAASAAQQGAFANGFSCVAQREAAGDGRGRIASREAEVAGPNTPNNLRPGGYTPCVYRAPATGVYDIVFTGPAGPNSNLEPQISGLLQPTAEDFGPAQRTSVTAWDVTVRDNLNRDEDARGRLFLYYLAGNTGGGGRQVESVGYVVTTYGFIYRVTYGGDPYGFIVYANQLGFRDSDGTPLYHNVVADPTAPTQAQNELRELQGGVQLLPPQYPIFFDEPSPQALQALGIPLAPEIPGVSGLSFRGQGTSNVTEVGVGGTFTFTTDQPGVYNLVISGDGESFAPRAPQNRLLRNVALEAGLQTVYWNGLDNEGEPFFEGNYLARIFIQGGEAHFPFLDVENNLSGGPVVQLINPPDTDGDGAGNCPPWNGDCFGAFYNDTGYRTANNTLVGEMAGPLCGEGVGNPPDILASDQVFGYDTRSRQRGFGFSYDANPASVCLPSGGFGDKKGLDLWTFYPSNMLETPLRIVAPLAITLLDFSAGVEDGEVALRWATGSERDTAGFRLLRSDTGERDDAAVVSPLIPARGSAAAGAEYRWIDPGADPAASATYWLQEVEVGGAVSEYGPAQLGPAPDAVGDFMVYLPALAR